MVVYLYRNTGVHIHISFKSRALLFSAVFFHTWSTETQQNKYIRLRFSNKLRHLMFNELEMVQKCLLLVHHLPLATTAILLLLYTGMGFVFGADNACSL